LNDTGAFIGLDKLIASFEVYIPSAWALFSKDALERYEVGLWTLTLIDEIKMN